MVGPSHLQMPFSDLKLPLTVPMWSSSSLTNVPLLAHLKDKFSTSILKIPGTPNLTPRPDTLKCH